MKAWKRVLIKSLILIAVILVFGGAAAFWQAGRQSTAEYAVSRYLSLILDNEAEKAYAVLDQSENQEMTLAEYSGALEAKKYTLYSSFEAEAGEKRRDSSGQEYLDFHVKYLDAAGEVQAEEDLTAKKQSEAVLGVFDRWAVLAGHCMVKNFTLTVPAGSEVYLNGEQADASWIQADESPASQDHYVIPELVPGKISLVVRHPALESVNTTLDAISGSADYTGQMALKESAQSECTELAVKLLKVVYSSAAAEEISDPDGLLADCQKAAEQLIDQQEEQFHTDGAEFRNAAVSDFAPQFGEITYEEDENGSISTEMTLSYRYVVREDVTTDTEEYQEDGTPVQQTDTVSHSGTATAKITMSFYDGDWHVTGLDMQTIPE